MLTNLDFKLSCLLDFFFSALVNIQEILALTYCLDCNNVAFMAIDPAAPSSLLQEHSARITSQLQMLTFLQMLRMKNF